MIRAPMTGQQAEALAAFLVSLRPGQRRWTKAACFDALTAAGRDRTNDAEALARAAIRAALTPSIVSPEVIAMQGAHWESIHERPDNEPTRAKLCPTCGTFHMPAGPCSGPIRITSQLHAHVAEAKAAIRKATA